MKAFVWMIGLALCGIAASGCTTYTTLQTPATLEPGSVNVGLGTAVPFDSKEVYLIPEVSARVGMMKGFDAGLKYSIGGLVFADGKLRLMEDPLRISADIGLSYFHAQNTEKTTDISTVGFYPGILVGEEHWYAGVRLTHITTTGQFTFFSTTTVNGSAWVATNVVLGGVLGEKVRLLPELNVYFPNNGKTFFVPAVGLQFSF